VELFILIRKEINFYDEFKVWYNKIIQDFNFEYQKDCKARDYISSIISEKENWDLDTILSLFKNDLSKKSIILIYGCGPSLERTILYLLKNGVNLNEQKILNIAADGASRLLREKHIATCAIFSDLDGITKNEFKYPNYMIVHAHGDNLERIKWFEKEIIEFEKIIFTTQVEPNENILNPGGFTDGDRILFFLRALLLPTQKLYLIGMDFFNLVGMYSKIGLQKKHKADPIKQKKLIYAAELIDWLKNQIKNDIYYVNSKKPSKNYENITLKQFLKVFK